MQHFENLCFSSQWLAKVYVTLKQACWFVGSEGWILTRGNTAGKLVCGYRIEYRDERSLALRWLINTCSDICKALLSMWNVFCVFDSIEFLIHGLKVSDCLLLMKGVGLKFWFISRLRFILFRVSVCWQSVKWLHQCGFHQLYLCCFALWSRSWTSVFCICYTVSERFCGGIASALDPARKAGGCTGA